MRTAILLLTFTACSGDAFTFLPTSIAFDAGEVPDAGPDAETREDSGDLPDVTPGDSGTDVVQDSAKPLCPPGDVEFGGRCLYLDGTNGVCDPGYAKSTNAKLAAVLGANPNAFQGKNYRHAVSDNACVLTKDSVENFGMVSHANVPGPFGVGEPVLSGSSCWMVYFTNPKQLTLCESNAPDGGQ